MPRTLVLHTGGTLGMGADPMEPGDYAAALIESMPELRSLSDFDSRIVCNLDSSDIGPSHWTLLAETIEAAREDYDGFIIVHGTDTLAYTASALAFALEGLDRTVILTGAQRPLSALRTDARRNLADAFELATKQISEVAVCFDGSLLRGCRTRKTNTRGYHAFESPGVQPLAKLGVDIVLSKGIRTPVSPFLCRPAFDARVAVVMLFPGMDAAFLRRVLALDEGCIRGVVLIPFGVGTVPVEGGVVEVLGEAIEAGVVVLVASSAVGMINLKLYSNSMALQRIGAVSAGEMTVEAAVCKLMHGLANFAERQELERYLLWNVAGERG